MTIRYSKRSLLMTKVIDVAKEEKKSGITKKRIDEAIKKLIAHKEKE